MNHHVKQILLNSFYSLGPTVRYGRVCRNRSFRWVSKIPQKVQVAIPHRRLRVNVLARHTHVCWGRNRLFAIVKLCDLRMQMLKFHSHIPVFKVTLLDDEASLYHCIIVPWEIYVTPYATTYHFYHLKKEIKWLLRMTHQWCTHHDSSINMETWVLLPYSLIHLSVLFTGS